MAAQRDTPTGSPTGSIAGSTAGWPAGSIAEPLAPPRVAIIGPTASGKSSVAFGVAAAADDIELISIDSMQVYRGMNIGTATPSVDDQARVTHHLIDVVDPSDEFTVAEFQRSVRDALDAVASRRHRAILVGGTGLYHRAILDDLDIPGQWPEVRHRLETELAASPDRDDHRAGLFQQLEALDPVGAGRIEAHNERRLLRALEVCLGSGRPFSSFGPGLEAYPPSPVRQIGLRWNRSRLAERIEQRVHAMIDAGLVSEVERLRSVGLSRTAQQALGYKEMFDYLDGFSGLDETIERIVTRTRQFAVRQDRWFRRDPRIEWIDVDRDPLAEAGPAVRAALDAVTPPGVSDQR